jgi:23S rRNA (guanosine2251-2'-O)-methyltransferase
MNIIFGRKPVLEAINAGEELEQIYILYGQKGFIITAIRVAAKKRGIKCTEIPEERFYSYSKDSVSQGVIAIKAEYKFTPLQIIIDSAKKSRYPLLLVLDSIQDTHNLGAILRTAECSGVDGIILTKHSSAPINQTVFKTSAGAVGYLKICPVNNLANTLEELKQSGFWTFGSSLQNAKNYTEVDYKLPLALVLGNEEKGIRKLTADKCDFLIKVPMKGEIQSLNVSVAAGIILFEILRQRTL